LCKHQLVEKLEPNTNPLDITYLSVFSLLMFFFKGLGKWRKGKFTVTFAARKLVVLEHLYIKPADYMQGPLMQQ
jgi:hypothetical protein